MPKRPENCRGLRLTPHGQEPAQLEPSDAFEQAKAIVEKRGCPEPGEQDPDSGNGRYRYTAKGPKGRTCKVLIGCYSRAVVRATP